MTKYSTKRALIASLLTLALCFTSLIGTTFAWFTDSATSGGNVIKSGKLDVVLEWAEGDEDPTAVTWKNAEDGAIFNYDKWEPGYVEAKHLKIKNAGNIAFKYKLSIVPDGTVEELADVIDVYYVEGATLITRDSLAGLTPVGTLRDMIEEPDGAIHGALLPAGESATNAYERVGEVTATIAFKMREDAGNEYQEKQIGAEFAIQLLATQYAYENDSFNNQYDEPCEYPYVSVPEKVDGAATEDIVLKAVGKEEKAATVTVPAALANAIVASDSDIESISVAHTEPKVEGNTIVFDDIAIVDQDGNAIDLEALGTGFAVTVTLPAQTVFAVGESVEIYHDDVSIGFATVNADTTITYTAEHFCEVTVLLYTEAKIGEVYYKDIAAALAAAVDGDTVVLLQNVSDLEADIKKDITLDLGGKTVTDAYVKIAADVAIKNGYIKNVNEPYPLVVNSGSLTVDGVNIEASKSDRAIWVRSGGDLVFNSGSILATKGENNTKTNLIAAIYTDSNTDVIINDGTITVDTPDNKAVAIFGNYSNANVTVNGGKISTSGKNYSYGINVDGDITVNGGEIVTNEKRYGYSSGITYGYNYALCSATGDVTVTGGSITTNGFSGYIVKVGRDYSANELTVSITGGTFKNVLSEVDMTKGGHKAPVLVWEGNDFKVTATVTGGEFSGFSADLLREEHADTTLVVSGGTFDAEIQAAFVAEGCELVDNADGTWTVK